MINKKKILPNKKFKDPKITINKVYTKSGDEGETCLVGGHKIAKSSLRITAYGEVDELNCFIGTCVSLIDCNYSKDKNLIFLLSFSEILQVLQHDLFNLGNMLATLPENYVDTMPRIDESRIQYIENIIDDFNKDLKPLKSFVLPGGHELCTRLHVSRAVCRRVERVVAQLKNKEEIDLIILVYLNRLSDFLFVASRWVNDLFDIKEVTWDPNYKKMGKDKVSHK